MFEPPPKVAHHTGAEERGGGGALRDLRRGGARGRGGAGGARARGGAPGAGGAGAEDASRRRGQRMTKEDLEEIRLLKEQERRARLEAADR